MTYSSYYLFLNCGVGNCVPVTVSNRIDGLHLVMAQVSRLHQFSGTWFDYIYRNPGQKWNYEISKSHVGYGRG